MIYRLLLPVTFFLLAFNSYAQVTFSNRNDLLSEKDVHSAVPVAVADMNGDGLDDIVTLQRGRILTVQYQVSERGRSFVRYELPENLATGEQNDIIVADFNNDGANDIFTIGSYDRVKILYAIPFTYEFERTEMVVVPFFSQGASSGDFNGDGWLDVVVLNDNGLNYTFMNDGSGNLQVQDYFNFVTNPTSDNSGNYGSVYTDFDMDGDSDFYIAKCRQGVNNPADPRRINVLFVNDGNNNYTEDAANYGLASGRQTWTADFGDIDNDGDQDVFMTQHDVISELFENINNDTFINITASAGLDIGGIPLQGMFRDFDNDGFLDILVSGDRIDFYYNNGDKTFTKTEPFGDIVFGTYATGDLNHDGFTDVYASRVIPFNNPDLLREDILYINEGNDNHFLSLDLSDPTGNTSAIGAQAIFYGEWGVQIRDVRAGEQYGVSNGHKMIFGLGDQTTYDSLIIRWPDGEKELYNGLAIDQHWQIEKGLCLSTPVKVWENLGVLCGPDSIILHLQLPEGSVTWSTGSVADSIVIKESGIYFATVTTDLGCNVLTEAMEVIVDPDTIKPVISYIGTTELCNMDVAVLSLPQFFEYQWSNGDTSRHIEVLVTGDYFAEVQGYCKSLQSDTIHLNFFVPQSPVVQSDTFKTGEDAILNATGDSIVWYDEFQSNIMGYGTTLTLSGLTETTILYAANLSPIVGEDYQIGPEQHQGSSKYNAAFINGGLLFDVHKPIILEDFTVFTDSAGVRIIEITDGVDFNYSQEVDLQPGETLITLNLPLEPGSYTATTNQDKNIEVFGDASPLLWRTLGGFTYPFEVPTILTINNSTYGEEFFYYFYDWHFSTQDRYCSSDFVPVTAFFDETVGIKDFERDDYITLSPNPTTGLVMVKSKSSNVFTCELVNVSGEILQKIDMQNDFTLDLSSYASDLYFLKVVSDNESKIYKIVRL